MKITTAATRTLLAFAAVAAPLAASAEIISFDLPTGLSSSAIIVDPGTPTFTGDDGTTVTVTAFTAPTGSDAAFPSTSPTASVVLDENGLGASSSGEPVDAISTQLDGVGIGEVIQFFFPMSVRLTKVYFSQVDPDDEFDFAVSLTSDATISSADDVNVDATFSSDNINTVGTATGNLVAVTIPATVTLDNEADTQVAAEGQIFQFYTNNANDDYKIAKIEIQPVDDQIDPNEQPIVPEPSAVLLLLTGIGFVGARRR